MQIIDQDVNRIGRFRIDGLIGRGGMGHVYKGFDEMLERPVALKALSPERRLSALDMTRFLREARILSQLDHPHICRIHDFIEWRDHEFLVLEFIEGSTLKEALIEGLSDELKIRIAQTVADVLEVAHKAEIIHRDIKPDNVMIDARGLIKVLDFGLGRKAQEDDLSELERLQAEDSLGSLDDDEDTGSSRTTVGSIVGTLRYMSPEAAQGEEVSIASDVFSYGMLLYEMFSGHSAYPDDFPQPALLLRVMQAQFRPLDEDTVPQPIAALIKDCLQLDPSKRPDAWEIGRRLRTIQQRPVEKAKTKRTLIASLISVFVLASTIALTWGLVKPKSLLTSDHETRVVLLPLVNLTSNDQNQWFSLGLRDLAALHLHDIGGLALVPDDQFMPMLQAEEVATDRLMEPDQIESFRKTLEADMVVMAWIDRSSGGYNINYQLIADRGEIASGGVVAQDAGEAGSMLGMELFEQFTGIQAQHKAASENQFVNQIYAVGMHRLSVMGAAQAHEFFRICLQLDPTFHEAQLQLAICLEKLGEWDQSVTLFHELLTLLADKSPAIRAECHRMLASIAQRRGYSEEALQELTLAMDLFVKSGHQIGIAQVNRQIGVMAYYAGDFDEANLRWQEALQAYRAARDALGEAKVLNNLGAMASNFGQMSESDAFHQRALVIRNKLRDREGLADTYNNLGSNAWHQSNYEAGERYFRAALKLYSDQGNQTRKAQVMSNLAECLKGSGDVAGAIQFTRTAIDLYQQVGNRTQMALSLNNLGDSYRMLGNFPLAEQYSFDSFSMHLDINDVPGSLWGLHSLALVAYERGETKQAIEIAEYAFASLSEYKHLDKEAALLNDLGEFHIQAGQYTQAEDYLKQARDRFERLESSHHIALVNYNLANLALQSGDPSKAWQLWYKAEAWYGENRLMYKLAGQIYLAEHKFRESVDAFQCAQFEDPQQWTWDQQRDLDLSLAKANASL